MAGVSPTFYRSYRPTGPLAGLVEHLWYCRIDGAAGSETVLPTGKGQLVFGLDPAASRATVQGPATAPAVVDATAQRRAVGVAFTRNGLAAVVPGSVAELMDRLVDLADLWGRDGAFLHERLAAVAGVGVDLGRSEAAAADAVLHRLGRAVAERAAALDRRPDPAVARSLALLDRGRSVAAVADDLGLDQRDLVARFRHDVGPTPKRVARLRRFETTLVALRAADAPDLATVAAERGFADQAHLSREIRALAGVTPSALHRDASPSPNHLVP